MVGYDILNDGISKDSLIRTYVTQTRQDAGNHWQHLCDSWCFGTFELLEQKTYHNISHQ